jgi:hypothetical protein
LNQSGKLLLVFLLINKENELGVRFKGRESYH